MTSPDSPPALPPRPNIIDPDHAGQANLAHAPARSPIQPPPAPAAGEALQKLPAVVLKRRSSTHDRAVFVLFLAGKSGLPVVAVPDFRKLLSEVGTSARRSGPTVAARQKAQVVEIDTAGFTWIKSSTSGANEGCLESMNADDRVIVRCSHDRAGSRLSLPWSAWSALLSSIAEPLL